MVAFPATIGRPEKPRTSASPLMPRRQRPSASQPAPVTSGHDTTPAIIGSPDEPRASAILANTRPPDPRPAPITPAMATFPATDEVRTHFGHSPSSPTTGLRTHVPLRSLPAMATFPATDEVRTNFGLMDPAGPPLTGHSSTLPPAAIVAATGKFKAPSSTRRTSPVMTNDRVSPPSPRPSPSPRPRAECRHNGSAIRRPISCGMPRRPACVYVRVFADASRYPLSFSPKRKNPQGTRPRGFPSGCISPVDFTLMP
jgi:hypothetical protein